MLKELFHISVVCGGQSPEHEISILSAQNVAKELLALGHVVDVVYISHDGQWQLLSSVSDFIESGINVVQCRPLVLLPGVVGPWRLADGSSAVQKVDVVFPLVHGTTGEDGCLQGLLRLLGVPYVGADVLGSAVAMHKDAAKRLWRAQGLLTCDWITVTCATRSTYNYKTVIQQLGEIVFLKPASQGSSIGVSKVTNALEFDCAMDLAFSVDDCVLIEPAIVGREIECSVMGYQNDVQASLPGELVVHHDFYSYDAKYVDPAGATVQAPAQLSIELSERIQALAVQAYRAVYCSGMARVDFFVNDDAIYLNELNTLPGFTDISLYPRNWQVSGLDISELLQRLVVSAIERGVTETLSTVSSIDVSDKV